MHPLTLHLTPTSTANIVVTSLTPTPSSTQAFVKIAPDAEVIVAPKTRQSVVKSSGRDNRSVASTSRKSAGGRSTASNVRHKSSREETFSKRPLFLRAFTRALGSEWFDEDNHELADKGLRVWLDREHLSSKAFRGATWVSVSLVNPAGLQEAVDPQSQPNPAESIAAKVVARLCSWDDAPDSRHAALSALLCATLGAEGLVGGIVRIEAAPPQLPKTGSAMKNAKQEVSKEAIVKSLRVTPFADVQATAREGFKFGGESKAEREEAAQRIKSMFGKTLFDGPLTDGMLLPARVQDELAAWPGGTLNFDPAPPSESSKKSVVWILGSDRKLNVEMQQETIKPKLPDQPGEPVPAVSPVLVGVDSLISQLRSDLLRSSSVLLTGGLGSGKTSMAQLLASQVRQQYLFNVIYYPCRTLVTDETRVSTIRETLQRIFSSAAWGARLGGKALVVLDDLDRLCPTETELQVGNDNGRSRQVSEIICSIARQYCNRDSGVVLLATAQSKEATNNVVIGGHVVRDIMSLKAPNKDGRRQVLELLVRPPKQSIAAETSNPVGNENAQNAWMDGSDNSRPSSAGNDTAFDVDPSLDLLDVAGQTDGYMPGDLALLVSRARSEALIRSVADIFASDGVTLTSEDFTAALKGFTPASLRNVTLQSSTTTFASIGGLQETRKILLETLQYPTTYAPIFAQCPLRLRSGLLLYGYPGCGKTLLASAVAGECGLNFISVKGPEILNKYIGASEKSVRDLFERAEAARPCVLFFDEFDSIAPKRGHDSTGVTDRVVNQLLTQMDGAEGLSGVYVLAATSRPDLIDPALLRPGRLDKSLLCDMPGLEDRLDILKALSGKLKMDHEVQRSSNDESLLEVARRTEGYSGADLQAVVYNAHLEAIHDVLGPADAAGEELGKSKTDGSASSTKYRDFTYFRLGANGNTTNGVQPPSAIIAERAQIATKLSQMQLARKRAKQQRRESQEDMPQANGAADDGHQEPVIQWQHLRKSMETTRSSISAQERRRLQVIYKEFIVGRNGDMSDGQGGSEIGGRSSLM